MASGASQFLEDLSWDEAARHFADGAILLLPIGAFAKEHGRHLPLKTDAVIAQDLARRAAKDLPVLIAPVIGFGHYPAFVDYAGSQSLSPETFIALVQEIVEGLIHQGARRIAVFNTGVSTEAPLAIAQRRIFERHGVRIAVADLRFLGRSADRLLDRPDGGHADERETSIMLAIDERLVTLSNARPMPPPAPRASGAFRVPVRLSTTESENPDFSPDGSTGDPTRATRAKGEALVAAIVEDLRLGLRATFPEAFAEPGTRAP